MKKFFLWLLIAAVFFTALAGCQSLTLTSKETQGADNSTPTQGEESPSVDNSTPTPGEGSPSVDNPTPTPGDGTPSVDNSTPSLGDGTLNVDISTLPLEEAYAYAVKKYQEDPENHRDLCDLQMETEQIIELDGKYYQSFIPAHVDIRYIWISHAEFPDDRGSRWDWYAVGTTEEYSLDLLGKVDEGRRDYPPLSSQTEEPLDVDISTLPLEEAYAYAVKKYQEDPENHRDLCDLQIETSHIVEIDGKYYQSFIAFYADIRYIWICNEEFPREDIATWDWYAVGTTEEYSLDLLGKVDEGRRDYPPSSSQTEEPLDVDISTLPLEEAYAYAVKKYEEDPENHRDLCDLQIETSHIVEIDGKYYQSFIAFYADIRYIWICNAEFPRESIATWDWYAVGTTEEYSLDLLGKVDEGRRD